MRNKISGVIGVVFGGAIIFNWVNTTDSLRGGAFGVGRGAALVLGILFIVGGLYYLLRGNDPRKTEPEA